MFVRNDAAESPRALPRAQRCPAVLRGNWYRATEGQARSAPNGDAERPGRPEPAAIPGTDPVSRTVRPQTFPRAADATIRSAAYVGLLVVVAVIGVVVSLAAWCFLETVYQIQRGLYTLLPNALGQ